MTTWRTTVVAVILFGAFAVGSESIGKNAMSDTKQFIDHMANLTDADPRVREKSADEMAMLAPKIGNEKVLLRAVKPLVALMADADMEVRDETAEALGRIGSRIKDKAALQSAIAALIKGLSDQESEVREECAEALDDVTSSLEDKALMKPFVKPLTRALGDYVTRGYARQILNAIGETEATAPPREQPKPTAPDMERDRYLVLDSRIIASTKNVELTVGVAHKDKNNPLFKEDKPWEPRFDNPYCSVIYDEEDKIYKCWYSIFIKSDYEATPPEKRAWLNWHEGRRGYGVCYATSKDGIHWEKPELGVIDYDGSKKNNIVIKHTHGVAVMKDLHEPDPQKRYKAIHGRGKVWFSPDGIHWDNGHGVGRIDDGDTNQSIWWDETLKRYVLITRHWGGARTGGRYGGAGQRQKSRSESSDFLNWTKPQVVIAGLDPRMQIHDMIVVPHAGVYLGMVGLFDIDASKQWCELAWSPDSIEWFRIQPGQPLIPNGPVMGDYDWGCIFAAKPIIRKDEILIYYGANDGRFMGWRSGYLALARLRADGFVGYEQIEGGSNKTGSLTTKPVKVVGNSLRITADVAPSGFVKVTLSDKAGKQSAEGELVTKTVTDAEIQWKDGFNFKKLKGTEIELEFELRESKLFSFSFDD